MAFTSISATNAAVVDAVVARSTKFRDRVRLTSLARSGTYEQMIVPAPASVAPAPSTTPHDALHAPHAPVPSELQAQVQTANVLVLPYPSSSGGTSYYPFVSAEGDAAQQAQLWEQAAHIIMAHAGCSAGVGVSAVPGDAAATLEAAFHAAGWTTAYNEPCFRCDHACC